MYNQSESKVTKLEAFLEDTKKQRDTTVSKCTHLSSEVDYLKLLVEELEADGIQW